MMSADTLNEAWTWLLIGHLSRRPDSEKVRDAAASLLGEASRWHHAVRHSSTGSRHASLTIAFQAIIAAESGRPDPGTPPGASSGRYDNVGTAAMLAITAWIDEMPARLRKAFAGELIAQFERYLEQTVPPPREGSFAAMMYRRRRKLSARAAKDPLAAVWVGLFDRWETATVHEQHWRATRLAATIEALENEWPDLAR